jgi:hypothetical protein
VWWLAWTGRHWDGPPDDQSIPDRRAAAREIREVASAGLADLQRLIGGYIETAYTWGSGDVLFVDEEGMRKPQRYFFRLRRRGDQPLAGNGVVVGPERYGDDGEYLGTDDVTLDLACLREAVTFLTRDQADAWAKGNASEPATVFYTFGDDGWVTEETVVRRLGRMFSDMPRPTDDGGK